MKIFKSNLIASLTLIISIIIFTSSLAYYYISAPSKDNTASTIEIKPGSIDSIATTLKKGGYIRNVLAFKVYVKLTNNTSLKAGTYSLSKDMNVAKIVDILATGSKLNNVKITFKEGINIRRLAKVIEENTNNSLENINNTLADKAYLKELINKYWFLTNDILNEDIYYPLEGYLFPSTYHFDTKDISPKVIIEAMLNETENQLDNYKEDIERSGKTVHELLSLASIIELEAAGADDRAKIAGVFYNRLENNMNIGSDVTTYYGVKVDIGERDLTRAEVQECNDYNTRCATFKTIPISPICTSSIDSIKAAILPDNNDYYYFVSDKNKKVYFSKTFTEHDNTISRLKREGLWLEY